MLEFFVMTFLRITYISLTSILLLFSSCFLHQHELGVSAGEFKKDGELSITHKGSACPAVITSLELSQTPEKRAKGLMYRTFLDKRCCMLFAFPFAMPCAFYMKNTHIPLDIIFIKPDKSIGSIYTYTIPESLNILPSASESQFVIEANAGFCDEYHVEVGDSVSFSFFPHVTFKPE